MSRLIRTALVAVIVWAGFVYATGRAVDREFASAGSLSEGERIPLVAVPRSGLANPSGLGFNSPASPSESASGGIGTTLIVTEAEYQGRNIRWWARRAVQARKDANARGRTIRRLQSAQRRDAAHFFAWLRGANCIYRHERGAAGWETRTGNGYYGGMQADRSFQRAYGSSYYRRWGTANEWPWWAQLHMAYNGWLARGWQPWPNTSRECGLR